MSRYHSHYIPAKPVLPFEPCVGNPCPHFSPICPTRTDPLTPSPFIHPQRSPPCKILPLVGSPNLAHAINHPLPSNNTPTTLTLHCLPRHTPCNINLPPPVRLLPRPKNLSPAHLLSPKSSVPCQHPLYTHSSTSLEPSRTRF